RGVVRLRIFVVYVPPPAGRKREDPACDSARGQTRRRVLHARLGRPGGWRACLSRTLASLERAHEGPFREPVPSRHATGWVCRSEDGREQQHVATWECG